MKLIARDESKDFLDNGTNITLCKAHLAQFATQKVKRFLGAWQI